MERLNQALITPVIWTVTLQVQKDKNVKMTATSCLQQIHDDLLNDIGYVQRAPDDRDLRYLEITRSQS